MREMNWSVILDDSEKLRNFCLERGGGFWFLFWT